MLEYFSALKITQILNTGFNISSLIWWNTILHIICPLELRTHKYSEKMRVLVTSHLVMRINLGFIPGSKNSWHTVDCGKNFAWNLIFYIIRSKWYRIILCKRFKLRGQLRIITKKINSRNTNNFTIKLKK